MGAMAEVEKLARELLDELESGITFEHECDHVCHNQEDKRCGANIKVKCPCGKVHDVECDNEVSFVCDERCGGNAELTFDDSDISIATKLRLALVQLDIERAQ